MVKFWVISVKFLRTYNISTIIVLYNFVALEIKTYSFLSIGHRDVINAGISIVINLIPDYFAQTKKRLVAEQAPRDQCGA